MIRGVYAALVVIAQEQEMLAAALVALQSLPGCPHHFDFEFLNSLHGRCFRCLMSGGLDFGEG